MSHIVYLSTQLLVRVIGKVVEVVSEQATKIVTNEELTHILVGYWEHGSYEQKGLALD